MINKKNLWFLTLFSLILVLSVYYITMPSELLLTNSSNYTNKKNEPKKTETKETIKVEESEILTALRVESDEELSGELDALKEVLTNSKSTADEKNVAFEKMKTLNTNKAEEAKLEKKLLDELKYKAFIKIEGDQVKVIIVEKKHDVAVANTVMRSVQSNFEKKMYITVQFKG